MPRTAVPTGLSLLPYCFEPKGEMRLNLGTGGSAAGGGRTGSTTRGETPEVGIPPRFLVFRRKAAPEIGKNPPA